MDPNTLGITVCLALVLMVLVYSLIVTPVVRRRKEADLKELELRVKMGGGLEMISVFLELADAYSGLGRFNEAESTMRKALTLAENEFGKKNPGLIPILKQYAGILAGMNRRVEADNMLRRAGEIKKS
ncbi:MAG: tetratricopeptide repeat protein [Candidatus Melainabacteria bacterium]|nr:tetratricopeptide repeat protein [Candidatus Melainabacteria bacterium]